jgi:hypothetical protein
LPSLSTAWNEAIPLPLDYYLHNSTFIALPQGLRKEMKNKKPPVLGGFIIAIARPIYW